MNLLKIRSANNLAIRRYERYGTRLFLKTLREQAVNFDPQIMVDAYVNFYQYVFVDSAKRGYYQIRSQEAMTKEIGLDSFFLSTWREWIKQYVLNNLATVIAGVNQRTLEQIREVTDQGLADGLNPFQLSKLLRKEVGSKARALAIARTEGTTANNMGTKRSAEDWQIQTGTRLFKVWIHSGNPRDPRPAHIAAQNKPIPKESDFVINGALLEFPGDQKGPLSERVNCLCSHAYLSERLARKRFPNAFE